MTSVPGKSKPWFASLLPCAEQDVLQSQHSLGRLRQRRISQSPWNISFINQPACLLFHPGPEQSGSLTLKWMAWERRMVKPLHPPGKCPATVSIRDGAESQGISVCPGKSGLCRSRAVEPCVPAATVQIHCFWKIHLCSLGWRTRVWNGTKDSQRWAMEIQDRFHISRYERLL